MSFKETESNVAFDCIQNRYHWHIGGHLLTSHDRAILAVLLLRIRHRGPFLYAKTLIEKLIGKEIIYSGPAY